MTADPRVFVRRTGSASVWRTAWKKLDSRPRNQVNGRSGLPMNGRNTQPIWAPTRANTITQRLKTVLTCLPRTRFSNGIERPRSEFRPRCRLPTPIPARRSLLNRRAAILGVGVETSEIQNAQPVQRLEQERQPERPRYAADDHVEEEHERIAGGAHREKRHDRPQRRQHRDHHPQRRHQQAHDRAPASAASRPGR